MPSTGRKPRHRPATRRHVALPQRREAGAAEQHACAGRQIGAHEQRQRKQEAGAEAPAQSPVARRARCGRAGSTKPARNAVAAAGSAKPRAAHLTYWKKRRAEHRADRDGDEHERQPERRAPAEEAPERREHDERQHQHERQVAVEAVAEHEHARARANSAGPARRSRRPSRRPRAPAQSRRPARCCAMRRPMPS